MMQQHHAAKNASELNSIHVIMGKGKSFAGSDTMCVRPRRRVVLIDNLFRLDYTTCESRVCTNMFPLR